MKVKLPFFFFLFGCSSILVGNIKWQVTLAKKLFYCKKSCLYQMLTKKKKL